MQPKSSSARPSISKLAFWDVQWESIDFEADSLFVIGKVLNYGTWDDIVAMLRYYGLERVRAEVVHGTYYKKTALSFLCLLLELEEQDFVVYQQRQARRPAWNH
ncbi:DUF6922 domain-containing protein [Arundinibacter roseus]|uniref:DUF6922 domain-containing protein n=1 Tax=Arundinibacter roseus TaxID=2070510 RepID=A0A4R4KQ39_9BACT|nr:hypothetical protein [Arundinibacter roseus]TDB69056.1 hypothetical protein EZE20_01605 [Arundinibacter roseus]